jgi:hypothetical protein
VLTQAVQPNDTSGGSSYELRELLLDVAPSLVT